MTFTGFTEQDFKVFEVPGLEARMEALIANVRPKLEVLGQEITPFISALCGEEMFVHVAKHARRTVNPPIDTWVAWAANKRGYKAIPHFEVGMFSTHVFVIFAIIYESPNKTILASQMKDHLSELQKQLPDNFYWSMDHMSPAGAMHKDLTEEELLQMADKLGRIKKSEIMCGLRINRGDDILEDGPGMVALIEQTFEKLLPLYKLSF